MKNVAVSILTVLAVAVAVDANADGARKRSRNSRVGPYVCARVGLTGYEGTHAADGARLLGFIADPGTPSQNVSASSDDSDIGYAFSFGYRFNRYYSLELGLARWGQLTNTARGELDFPGDNQGFVPASTRFKFTVGGLVISGIGILPINDQFELFVRGGVLFASSERNLYLSIGTNDPIPGSVKGDSQSLVVAGGVHWNINTMYSLAADYERVSDVGDSHRTGSEDINQISLGLIVRF